jgi:7,8-dihydropterin-6-yl-methyl-4-(beta-D-ribofuranosyl)aminobenzene 5'-phosphate synthase
VLFDTGENGEWLLENMGELAIDINKIKSIVISHDHWDHTGGLWDFLEQKPDVKVYGCPGFSEEFKQKVRISGAQLVENSNPSLINANLSVSGEIAFMYKNAPMSEQALIAHSPEGLSIITGCAHPGIITMIRKIMEQNPGRKINLVAGGFHLKDTGSDAIREIAKEFRTFGVDKAAPTHCSGDEAQKIFREIYGDRFFEILVGESIDIS